MQRASGLMRNWRMRICNAFLTWNCVDHDKRGMGKIFCTKIDILKDQEFISEGDYKNVSLMTAGA